MIITCVGDCGVDSYTDISVLRPGGITLNFAIHSRALFPSTDTIQIVSAIGTDMNSSLVEKTIKDNNIASYITKLEGNTPIQYITLDKNKEKNFTKYEEGVLQGYSINQEQQQIIQNSDFVIMVIFNQLESLFESAIKSQFKGLVAIDFMNLADYGKNTDIVEKYIKYFDIGFFGLKKDETELINKLQNIANINKKIFVITLGSEGSIAQDVDISFSEKAVPVNHVKDTTGAGDAFAAAFIKTYLYTKNIGLSLKAGSSYASDIVQKIGSF